MTVPLGGLFQYTRRSIFVSASVHTYTTYMHLLKYIAHLSVSSLDPKLYYFFAVNSRPASYERLSGEHLLAILCCNTASCAVFLVPAGFLQ
jgi:hypothetical protein